MTVLCHVYLLPGTVPKAIAVGRAALPWRQTFLHKNIPQSANLLLHLSGSHLATHKLHYSFLPYLASSSFFFSPVHESFWLQTLGSLLCISLTTLFHLFGILWWPKLLLTTAKLIWPPNSLLDCWLSPPFAGVMAWIPRTKPLSKT